MELPRLTPTNVSDLDCAKKFYTLRIRKEWPARPPLLAREFGTAFHEILRHVFDPRQRPLPNLEHLDAWARAAFFARDYPDSDLREQEMTRCLRLVAHYARQDEDAESTLDVERQGEFPIFIKDRPLFLLSAKLDRVMVRAAERTRLVVRDYKCSRPYRNLEEAFVILWVAKLLYPNYRYYALELDWIAEDGALERDIIEGAQVRGMYAVVVEKALRVLMHTEYPAEPGEACQGCVLRPQCQPQIAVHLNTDREVFEPE